MRHSFRSRRAQGIAALLALPALAGCADAPVPRLPDAARPPPPGAVRVRLAFPERADLDLYVTGPSQETVYFANPRAADGGHLDGDRRCGDPAPRVETVVFADAAPGSYRVGIDFPERCDGGSERVPYRLEWEAPGAVTGRVDGEIAFGKLEVLITEFSISD